MTAFLVNAISMGVVFLFGCIGEILTEKAGNLNLGIPGIMCIGAVGGCLSVTLIGASAPAFLVVLLAIVLSMIFAGLGGLIYAFITVTLKGNQNVTGLALTTFGVGFMKFFSKKIYTQSLYAASSSYFKNFFGLSSKKDFFSQVFLSHGVLVYLAIVIAVLATLMLNHTRVGLHLRAVGEAPATADAAGINIAKYKYGFITLGSAIAGLGGLYYVMDRASGTTFAEAPIDSFGWMAIALVIATMWKPVVAILGSFLFGGLTVLGAQLTSLTLSEKKIFVILPYLITVVVLIITSVRNKPENQPPAGLGVNYYREDR